MTGGLRRDLGIVPLAAVVFLNVSVSAACYAAFAVFSFTELIVLNIWLYCLSLLVELAAFAWLRLAAPDLPRPWRVPGGVPGAVAAVALPASCCLLAMATAGWLNTAAGVLAALSGLVAYRLLRRPAAAGDDTLAGERGRAWGAS